MTEFYENSKKEIQNTNEIKKDTLKKQKDFKTFSKTTKNFLLFKNDNNKENKSSNDMIDEIKEKLSEFRKFFESASIQEILFLSNIIYNIKRELENNGNEPLPISLFSLKQDFKNIEDLSSDELQQKIQLIKENTIQGLKKKLKNYFNNECKAILYIENKIFEIKQIIQNFQISQQIIRTKLKILKNIYLVILLLYIFLEI